MTAPRIDHVVDALADAADPERAAGMEAYMKGHFDFLGIDSPRRRELTRDFVNSTRTCAPGELLDVAEQLWRLDEREYQYVALDVLKRRASQLTPAELPRIEALIRTHSWWDTVDILAAHPVGAIVDAYPAQVDTMDAWIGDDDLWVARTAILHQLRYRHATDAERLFAYVDRHAASTEFFVRKACGWALREYAKVAPDAVRSFVDERTDQLSGLTQREALKHLR